MKKVFIVVAAFLLAYCAYDLYNKNMVDDVIELKKGQTVEVAPQFDMVYDGSERVYKKAELNAECSAKNEITCAVEAMVKCSINPELEICDKSKLPDFVFMQDENLGRPSEVSYQITGMKPIDRNTLEVHTKSDCNGQWFGLCKGKVIYVIDNSKGFFRVKDVYALGE